MTLVRRVDRRRSLGAWALACGFSFVAAVAAVWRVDWSAFAPAAPPPPIIKSMPPHAMATPFAPLRAGSDAMSAALASRLAGMRLAGVRVASDPGRSGAIIVFADGVQRAFIPGQEIAPGVRLAEVGPSYVALEFDGVHRRRLTLGDGFGPGGASSLGDAVRAQASAAAQARAETSAWLMGILMEGVGGGLDGWTVGAPVPPLAARAGLQHGDVIVSVNGVGPEAGAAALGVISAPAFELSVRRANGESVAISIETGA